MNERDAFIAGIKADPADDTRRLAFADWLDEYGQHDRDRATAEFIRMSCTDVLTGKVRKSLDRQVGKWLSQRKYTGEMNGDGSLGMGRLIPALAQWVDQQNRESIEKRGRPVIEYKREGRWLRFRGRTPEVFASFSLEYWRGFVRKATFCCHRHADHILHLLIPDQPLCEPELPVFSRKAWKKTFIWENAVGEPVWRHILSLPKPWKPDITGDAHDLGGQARIGWEDWETRPHLPPHAERARWAVCIAMHAAAREIMDGKREPGCPLLKTDIPEPVEAT